jgi:hypothetical protein
MGDGVALPPISMSRLTPAIAAASLAIVLAGTAFAATVTNRQISIGTMLMRGKAAGPLVYDVGTLSLTGQADANGTSFDVGTLMLTGQSGAGTSFDVGTLAYTGSAGLGTSFDVGTLSVAGRRP